MSEAATPSWCVENAGAAQNRGYHSQRSGTRTTRKPSGSSNVTRAEPSTGVCRRDRILVEARRDGLHGLITAEVEHEQRVRMRRRSAMPTARCQLEVRAGARHREKHAVVAVVIAEATDLGQPDAVSVEPDDLVQSLGVPGNAQPHRSALRPRRGRAQANADHRLSAWTFSGHGALGTHGVDRADTDAACSSRTNGPTRTSSHGTAPSVSCRAGGSVGDLPSEVCWVAVTNDGRFAFVANFGDWNRLELCARRGRLLG